MPPPVPERVANPRIREDRVAQDFQQNSEKMHRATSEDAYTKAWFDCCRRIFPTIREEGRPGVDFYNVSTYQCSILFNNMGSFNRKSEFRKAETVGKPISSNENFHVASDLLGNNCAHVILTAQADSLPTDARKLLSTTMAQWDVIRAEAMTCQSTQELILQGMFAFNGNQMMTEMDMPQSLRSSLAKRQKEQPQNRVSDQLSSFLTLWSLLR